MATHSIVTGNVTAICFASGAPAAAVIPVAHGLRSGHAEAMAQLLSVLACGEESAGLAFARFSGSSALGRAAQAELEQIRQEEQCHERWLCGLRTELPTPQHDETLRSATRRFFLRLNDDNMGRHLARIAALDSAVCQILGTALNTAPLRAETGIRNVFSRILRDEARHVLVSSRYARLLYPRGAVDIAQETREALIRLLQLRGAEMEQLDIDTARLFRRLSRIPRRLFS